MMDELYIDGKRVELNDIGISLDYKSNLLTDISKIVSNNSYTIKAPKTTENIRLIDGFIYPSTVGEYPYKAHSGVVVRDGVEIIKDATVYLLSIGEEIEFCLVWGIGSKFDNIKNKKLTEMPIVDGDTVAWDPEAGFDSSKYLDINYGIDFPSPLAPKMPHITAYDLLVRVFKSNNIPLVIEDAGIENNLKTLAIPLLGRNDCPVNSKKNETSVFSTTKVAGGFLPATFVSSSDILFIGSANKMNIYGVWNYSPDLKGIVGYWPAYPQKITLGGVVNGKLSASTRIILVLYKDDPVAKTKEEIIRIEGVVKGTNFSVPLDGIEVDLDSSFTQGTTMRFMLAWQSNDLVTSFSASISATPFFERIIPSMDYYVVPNLPDMKQIDFIKGLCQMFNYYAFLEDDGVHIVSFNRLISNKSKAVDWSGRLVSVPDMTFAVDGINQNNIVKYKDDDSVKGNYNSQFKVDNQALKLEGELITLHFAASDTRSGKAYIPIYSYDKEGDVEIEDKTTARIVRIKERGGIKLGSFEGLDWGSLLKSYYGQYIATVGKAKVISCNIILSCVDLKSLDMSVPVYINSLGGYFGIVEIKTKKGDVCEVSLIKI